MRTNSIYVTIMYVISNNHTYEFFYKLFLKLIEKVPSVKYITADSAGAPIKAINLINKRFSQEGIELIYRDCAFHINQALNKQLITKTNYEDEILNRNEVEVRELCRMASTREFINPEFIRNKIADLAEDRQIYLNNQWFDYNIEIPPKSWFQSKVINKIPFAA